MLAVLALLISRAAQPASWLWLTGESKAQVGAQVEANQSPAKVSTQPTATPPEPVTVGTDLDGEEQAEVEEQFQALSDFSLGMAPEEMPAYWRMFRWTNRQTFEQMRQRAEQKPLFNQFVQFRDKHRGKLFRLDLTVRQVLAYPAAKNSADVKEVFEISGTTEQSQAWYYMVLTSDLPSGMPRGKINERATFVGYFLKVQGYQPGGASPNDKPLPAPLLIGRLQWRPAPTAAPQSDWELVWNARNSRWIWWIAGTVLVFAIGRLGMWWFRGGRGAQAEVADGKIPPHKAGAVRDWLNAAEEAAAAGGNGASRNSDFQNN